MAQIIGHAKHLRNDTAALLDKSPEERIAAVKQERFIPYEEGVRILQEMERLFSYPNVVRPRGLLLWGPSGVGKSTITWQFQDIHPPMKRKDDEGRIRPVVTILCPSKPEPRLILTRILKHFDPLGFEKGSADHMYFRTLGYFEDCRVKLLQIDDVDGLIDTGTNRQLRDTLETLRRLSEESGVSIVMTGIQKAERVLSPVPRLASRFRAIKMPVVQDDDDYIKFLYSKETVVPLPRPSNLWSKEKRMLLLDKCNGIRGDIIDTINESAVQAILEGAESITLERLKENLVNSHKGKQTKDDQPA